MPNPRLRRHERGPAQRQRRRGAQTIGQAAPWPVLRAPNEPCSECVPFDVPADAEQPVWRGHRLQGEALLINRVAIQSRPGALESGGMGSCYPLDQPCESRRSHRTEHEMPVIIHHAVREQRQWMTLEPFTHNLQEVPIILRPRKQRGREQRSMNDVKIAVGGSLCGASHHGVDLSH
jgi:hypothetical protein